MRFISVFLFFFFLITFGLNAQHRITGYVVNGLDSTRLEGANVFINNGSHGTITNAKGEFELTNITLSTFELVISFVSYETILVKITPENMGKRFRVELKPKTKALNEIVILPQIPNGWKSYGKFFTDMFIGTSDNSADCVIKNPGVLTFHFDKKQNQLVANAKDLLIIENNSLGYTISYQLEQWSFDYRKKMLAYSGYSSFKEMETSNSRKQQRWIKRRKVAYLGSVMHFMRSLHKNKLTEEGYEIHEQRRLFKNDPDVEEFYKEIMSRNYNNLDTSKYVVHIMKPNFAVSPDPVIYLYGREILSPDSIRYAEAGNVYLTFPYYLTVVYKNEFEPYEYASLHTTGIIQSTSRSISRNNQRSVIELANGRPILADASGLYFEPLDLFMEEYWAWEKMAEMLPADYKEGTRN